MTTKTFVIHRHEAVWALDFLATFLSTRPGVPDLKQKLQRLEGNIDQLAIELSGDEVGLCVEGYEQQRDTKWVKGKPRGKKPVDDPIPRFTPEKTNLYGRMKGFLEDEGERAD